MDTAQLEKLFELASIEARKATCHRRKCGSIIVKHGLIIGRGHNSPPHDEESQRRCDEAIDKRAKYPTDKTCCVHAEQRAMFDAMLHHGKHIEGADLIFASVNEDGEMLYSGEPYCTHCSKMALDLGIKHFGLWRPEGAKLWPTAEYNDMSFASASQRK